MALLNVAAAYIVGADDLVLVVTPLGARGGRVPVVK